jgi:hypothetical protein
MREVSSGVLEDEETWSCVHETPGQHSEISRPIIHAKPRRAARPLKRVSWQPPKAVSIMEDSMPPAAGVVPEPNPLPDAWAPEGPSA